MDNDLITLVKPEKGGAVIQVNGEEYLWLSREIWLEKRFTENETFDLQAFKEWLLPRQYPEALNTAVAMLALRARSSGEVRKKLEQKRYIDDVVEMVLYKLETEHLLDDAAFAREWAETCSQRQMGRWRIIQELRQKGVDKETAEQAVDALDSEAGNTAAVELAAKLLRRYVNEPDARKAMNKLMAAMTRRGYGFEEAKNAVTEAMAMAEDE